MKGEIASANLTLLDHDLSLHHYQAARVKQEIHP